MEEARGGGSKVDGAGDGAAREDRIECECRFDVPAVARVSWERTIEVATRWQKMIVNWFGPLL